MILRSLVVIVGCVNIMSDITVIIVLNECYMFFLSFGELLQILFLHCPQCDGCISLSLSLMSENKDNRHLARILHRLFTDDTCGEPRISLAFTANYQ